jgi:hypothetical protein
VGRLVRRFIRQRVRKSDVLSSRPAGGGRKLCWAIREDEDLRHLPIFLLTAGPDGERPGDFLEVGGSACALGPFALSEL